MTATRIAIVKLSSIGDVVLASAVPRALKRAHPRCEITWVVERRCAELVAANPCVDHVLEVPGARFSALRAVGREVRRRQFEAVLDLQGIMKSSVIVAMSGAPRRITGSFARPMAQRAATDVVDCGPGHAAELYLRCAGALGAVASDGSVGREASLVAPITEEDRAFAADFLAGNSPLPILLRSGQDNHESPITNHSSAALRAGLSPLVGLNPGASRADKRWPPERFAAVVDALSAEGARVILFGAAGDRALGDRVQELMRQPPIDAVGRTTLRQLTALAEHCEVFLTNDTGPMHLAAAAGARVVGIFGASDPRFTGPVGAGHVVFWKAETLADARRRGEELLAQVTVDEVLAVCREVLRERAPQSEARAMPVGAGTL